MLLLLTAMAFALGAFGRKFRLYTVVTIAVMLAFGAWSGMDATRIEAGLPTPWVGARERIFWYAYQVWFIVLAVTMLRRGGPDARKRVAPSAGLGEPIY
jgi:NADH:ubiquinone oxidoreductase subunit H